MLVYTFDRTLDGLLTAVFDSFALHQQPDELVGEDEVLPMFCDEVHHVQTADEKAARVWTGLEKLLSKEALRIITISYYSEDNQLDTPLFKYICKIFVAKADISNNYADEDILFVRNTCRRVLHEQLRMKQFVRFQKTKDGTYLGVVAPDHNVLPLVIEHFRDRFNDQPWLLYDARRRFGYYYDSETITRITFENDDAIPFNLDNGKLNDDLLSADDQLLQNMWRTYFKAICIKERLNPRKQRSDMPRRYWKYITEKNG